MLGTRTKRFSGVPFAIAVAVAGCAVPASGSVSPPADPVSTAAVITTLNHPAPLVSSSDRHQVALLARCVAPITRNGELTRLRAAFSTRLTEIGDVEVRPALTFQPADRELASRLGLDRWLRVTFPIGAELESGKSLLLGLADVELVEEDSIGHAHYVDCLASDPLVAQQWWAANSGQIVQGVVGMINADANIAEAWCISAGAPSVILAVLDTGVSLSHPDLQGGRLQGFNFINNNTNTDDGLSLSHGTFCAGIALGRGFNSIGIAGVAPATTLLPVKVLSGSLGTETSTANGLIWAVDQGAKVVNMSLGFPQGSTFFRDAVIYARDRDVIMVASTGNSPGAAVGYPAKWSSCIAVGATDNRDQAASFQTTGVEMDICAPGLNILTATDMFTNVDGYSLQSGTSMAAPMVAGTAALIRAMRPSLTAPEVREILLTTAKDLGQPGTDPVFGAGRLNSGAAVREAIVYGRRGVPDFNGDTHVDIADLVAFIEYWQLGSIDYNADGVTDLADLVAFLSIWQG